MLGRSSPTHGWLIGNRIIRAFAWGFIIIVFVAFIFLARVQYAVQRDCQDVYKKDVKIFGYWLHLEAGSNKTGCPGAGR